MRSTQILRMAIPMLLALVIAGCDDPPPTPVFLYPLYDELTATADSKLIGPWWEDGGDDDTIWTFEESKPARYTLSLQSAGPEGETKVSRFDAVLVQLAGRLFLDLCSEDSGITGAPAHMVAGLRIENDADGTRLKLDMLKDSWMKDALEEDATLSRLPATHGKVIVTANTLDMQYFFMRHAWEEDAVETITLVGPDQTGCEGI